MTQLKVMDPKDKKKLVALYKRGTKIDTIRGKFPQYTNRQIGAIQQHMSKGDY